MNRKPSPNLVKEVIQKGLKYEAEVTTVRPPKFDGEDLLERTTYETKECDTEIQAINWCLLKIKSLRAYECATVTEISKFNPDHFKQKWYKDALGEIRY